MDLSKITAEVRPRTPYEAVDLGLMMARTGFKPLLLLYLIPSFPLMLLLYLIFWKQPIWALFIIWWLKPLLESIQLKFISERLFQAKTHWKAHLKHSAKTAFHQVLTKLVFQRFSLSRSFNMPVGELERLNGKQRNKRLNTLHRGAGSSVYWLTLCCTLIETLLVLNLFALTWMFIPMELQMEFYFNAFVRSPEFLGIVCWAGYFAIILVSPFYVCSGFCLYINRRTWLEAWDIELTFRQLATQVQPRIHSNALLILLLPILGLLCLPIPTPSYASADPRAITPDSNKHAIMEILEGDDFHRTETYTDYRWKQADYEFETEDEQETPEWLKTFIEWLADHFDISSDENNTTSDTINFRQWMGIVLEFCLWAVAIIAIIWLIQRFLHLPLPSISRKTKPKHPPPPTQLFGLALDQAPPPEDVHTQALTLWQHQHYREAFSLLYQAALSYLVFQRHLPLDNSLTEHECVQLCQQHEPDSRSAYFASMTQQWILLAYGHQPIPDSEFEQLCHQWPQFQSPDHRP